MSKRVFDLIASSISLVLLAPVMAVIAILVRRDSEGPALFKQERVGRGGKAFTLLKFRSMTASPATQGPLVTSATDTRITKLGAKLRASKLDELPQLVNVVRGDMSLVGPRPEVAKYVDLWPQEDREVILSVRPGITDPATVQLLREEEILAQQADPEEYYITHLIPEKVRGYAEYARTHSALGDASIILATLKQVLKG